MPGPGAVLRGVLSYIVFSFISARRLEQAVILAVEVIEPIKIKIREVRQHHPQ